MSANPEGRLTDKQREAVEAFRKRHRTAVLALLFTDVERSTALRSEMGDLPASALIQRHNELIRAVLGEFAEAQEISTAGDSFLTVFAKPSDAVRFALLAQKRLRDLAAQERPDFRVRMGIHLGEVAVEEETEGGPAHDVLGMQVDIASRTMSLAAGGQILMTRGVFDNARQILKGQSLPGIAGLAWVSHGPYLLKGFDEPLAICEVGERDVATLRPPTDSEVGKRAVVPGTEPVLGWRPAVEQTVPGTEWELETKLGEGGFGEVWLGRHRRTKELRVFKFCFRADQLRSLKRELTLFRLLKEVLGERPDIARLYNVQFEEAPYYLELEYTAGGDLASWIESRGGFEGRGPRDEGRGVSMELRLEIVAQIAAALAAAHSVGVIHEDVKPSNVLVEERAVGLVGPVGPVGRVGQVRQVGQVGRSSHDIQVRLTDFGIGQVMDRAIIERAGITATGLTELVSPTAGLSTRTGTRLYMAPELIAGRPPSTKSDLYSLGVLFYQMIVGDLSQPVATDWERRVDDPLLREDLHGCLAGEPTDRFASAEELADRLRNLSRRRTRRRMRQLTRTAAALAILLVVLVGAWSWLQFSRRRQAERTAVVERNLRAQTERQLYYANVALAETHIKNLRYNQARDLLTSCPAQYRNWEWGRLQYLCNLDLMTLRGHTDSVWVIALSPDGNRLATASRDKTAKLWDLETGQCLRTFEGHTATVTSVAFSPDGKWLATASSDRTIRIWDPATGELVHTLRGHGDQVSCIAFSSDGRILVSGGILSDPSARIWDPSTGKQLGQIPEQTGAVLWLAFSPDSRLLAMSSTDNTVRLWDFETSRSLGRFEGHAGSVFGVAFSPDGKRLATAGRDKTAKLWDVATSRCLRTLEGHDGGVVVAAFSPNGRYLATGSWDKTAKLWDIATFQCIRTFKGHTDAVYTLAFCAGGKSLVTGSRDRTLKMWSLELPDDHVLVEAHEGGVHSLAFSSDGRQIATAGEDWAVRIWDPDTGAERLRLWGDFGPAYGANLSRNGRFLAAGFRGGLARVWDLEAGGRTPILSMQWGQIRPKWHLGSIHRCGVHGLAFDPNSARLVTTSANRSNRFFGLNAAKVWDAKTGRLLLTLDGHSGSVTGATFSPDGMHIVTASRDGTARLWDGETGQHLRTFEKNAAIWDVAFSPHGRLLATGDLDAKMRIWDVETGQCLRTFEGHTGSINGVAFGPPNSGDGKRLATVSDDGSAILWDVGTGRQVMAFDEHSQGVMDVAFSPRGDCLATAGWDGTMILRPSFPWDENEYPGASTMPLDDRIELYKREYWKRRLTAIHKPWPVAKGQRFLSASAYSPGVALRVKLNLTWKADASSLTVIETVPESWSIQDISQSGKSNENTIVWQLTRWASPGATLTYTVTPPDGSGFTRAFFGGAIVRHGSECRSAVEETHFPRLGTLAFQESTLPHPDYAGCQDAHLVEFAKDNNTGACRLIEEGDWRGGITDHKKTLVQFDLSAVPSTFSLGRAELRLYAFGEAVGEWRNPHTLFATRVLKPWNEGAGGPDRDGTPAQEGDATFNSPRHGRERWEIPGALGVTDVADAESSATAGEDYPGWIAFDVTQSVRLFLSDPSSNHGWKISQDPIRGVEDTTIKYAPGIYFHASSEAPPAHLRPMLLLVPEENQDAD